MSPDFFADLERHLDRAARRQARWGRLASAPRPAPGAVAALALVAALVVAGMLALPRAGTDEREIAAGPGPDRREVTRITCEEHNARPIAVADGPAPAALLERFSVLRSGARARPVTPDLLAGPSLWGVYLEAARLAREETGRRWYLVPVADIDEDPLPPNANACAAPDKRPAEKMRPGLCLLYLGTGNDRGLACFTLEEIEAGDSVIAERPEGDGREVFALVPDGHPTVLVGTEGPDREPRAGTAEDVIGNLAVGEVTGAGDAPVRWQPFPDSP